MDTAETVLEVAEFETILAGLRELLNAACSMAQNIRVKADTFRLPDHTHLWKTLLDSRTMQLYGGVDKDKRHRFKIDHCFDLATVTDTPLCPDGSFAIDEQVYSQSQGAEFIVVPQNELKGAQSEYAIRLDKYRLIMARLSEGDYPLEEFKKAGGFSVCWQLTPKEVVTHDGWLELAVGKNKASREEYANASHLMESYVDAGDIHDIDRGHIGYQRIEICPRERTLFGFSADTSEKGYKARSWYMKDFGGASNSSIRFMLRDKGYFLMKRRKAALTYTLPA